MRLKVLFAASECAPLVKVGGLADMVGSLPKTLRKLGVEVGIALPGYKNLFGVKTLPGTDIPLFLVENEEYFGGSEKPYWETGDDPKRFGYFSRQVVQGLPQWGFKPDVIHVHDWHASLVPVIVRKIGLSYATVLTIHNLHFQGVSSGDVFFPAGLSEHDLQTLEWDYRDRNIDQLLQGIIHANVINTVSPTYAREILSPEFGEGLHEILKAREARLFGILNGVDYDIYDPSRDKEIYQNFGLKNFEEGKWANKQALQRALGFEINKEMMLVGFVARLSDQKGLSLIIEGFEKMMEFKLQFVLLGMGDARYERQFRELAQAYPSRFSAQTKFDTPLAHKIYAGADLFLIPSRFEPCGLTQMIAMRYGALPLVRSIGGLADSVSEGEDGFVFEKYEAGQVLATLRRALRTFGTLVWKKMVGAAMQKDFSWEKSARKYIKLYEKALEYAKS